MSSDRSYPSPNTALAATQKVQRLLFQILEDNSLLAHAIVTAPDDRVSYHLDRFLQSFKKPPVLQSDPGRNQSGHFRLLKKVFFPEKDVKFNHMKCVHGNKNGMAWFSELKQEDHLPSRELTFWESDKFDLDGTFLWRIDGKYSFASFSHIDYLLEENLLEKDDGTCYVFSILDAKQIPRLVCVRRYAREVIFEFRKGDDQKYKFPRGTIVVSC